MRKSRRLPVSTVGAFFGSIYLIAYLNIQYAMHINMRQGSVTSQLIILPTLDRKPKNNTSNEKIDDSKTPTSYAYMFLIGGIDPNNPVGYMGFLYNVLIATNTLRKFGSTSDVWLFLQMHPKSTASEIPKKEKEVLEKLEIHTQYLEKPSHSSFSDTTMEKFRILQLTQYKRVMFLDADVLPLMNMDYLMHLSDPDSKEHNISSPLIQPNFVVATRGEPSNAGCFMLEPRKGAYNDLLQVIDKQKESARNLSYPFFDKYLGWGHNFYHGGDKWEGTKKTGQHWNWHAAHTDQGLLYYWVRYHEKNYTSFRGHVVENFIAGKKSYPDKDQSFDPDIFRLYSPMEEGCSDHPETPVKCKTPYSHYAHYMGKTKPWQIGYRQELMKNSNTYRIWFEGLFDLSARFNLNFTTNNVNEKLQGAPVFGHMPKPWDIAKRLQGDSSKFNFTSIELNKTKQ